MTYYDDDNFLLSTDSLNPTPNDQLRPVEPIKDQSLLTIKFIKYLMRFFSKYAFYIKMGVLSLK